MENSLNQLEILFLPFILLLQLILQFLYLLLLILTLLCQVHHNLTRHQRWVCRIHVVEDFFNSIHI
jgi:hypothetical protein